MANDIYTYRGHAHDYKCSQQNGQITVEVTCRALNHVLSIRVRKQDLPDLNGCRIHLDSLNLYRCVPSYFYDGEPRVRFVSPSSAIGKRLVKFAYGIKCRMGYKAPFPLPPLVALSPEKVISEETEVSEIEPIETFESVSEESVEDGSFKKKFEEMHTFLNPQIKMKQEREYLLAYKDPRIGCYYGHLSSGLCTLLQSLVLVNNKKFAVVAVAKGKATAWSNAIGSDATLRTGPRPFKVKAIKAASKASSHFCRIGELLNPLLGFVPHPSAGLAKGILSEIFALANQDKVNQTRQLLNRYFPSELEAIAHEIAYKVTLSYQAQIRLLSEKEEGKYVIKFAEAAIRCIGASLLNGVIPKEGSFVTHAWLTMPKIRCYEHQVSSILGIDFFESNLKGVKQQQFKANDLYCGLGIVYLEEGHRMVMRKGNPAFGNLRISKEEMKYFY